MKTTLIDPTDSAEPGVGTMAALMKQIAKSKGQSGYVVFVRHRMVPGAQPKFGRPEGTRDEATKVALGMLDTPHFVKAWTVGRDGIYEVTR